jgi:hypothetical protein
MSKTIAWKQIVLSSKPFNFGVGYLQELSELFNALIK